MGDFGILWGMKIETLQKFCTLHGTPGDEGEVFDALRRRWMDQGLDVTQLGGYAIYAAPGERKKSDTVLLMAHADSPGFIVESIVSPQELQVLVLGGIDAAEYAGAELVLKTSSEVVKGRLMPVRSSLEWTDGAGWKRVAWSRKEPVRVVLDAPCETVRKGDRLMWAVHWEEEDGIITSPFLDNRIACALVADWYDEHADALAEYNVIVAATAMEEVTGFGANVLARHLGVDAAIALDVTYECESQGVKMGQGPVVTLSDVSVLLSPKFRDRLLACGVPLQTEVYNYAGTDARAFPAQGVPIPVVPMLLATDGNHSPRERIARADLEAWHKGIVAVTKTLFNRVDEA